LINGVQKIFMHFLVVNRVIVSIFSIVRTVYKITDVVCGFPFRDYRNFLRKVI